MYIHTYIYIDTYIYREKDGSLLHNMEIYIQNKIKLLGNTRTTPKGNSSNCSETS